MSCVPSAQELREAIQTRIRLSIEAVFGQIPFAADLQHPITDVIPVSRVRKGVSPTKLRHLFEAEAFLHVRHPCRKCTLNDCQIAPATKLCARSCYSHDCCLAQRTECASSSLTSAQDNLASAPHFPMPAISPWPL